MGDGNDWVEVSLEGAFGSGDFEVGPFEIDFDAVGQGYGLFAYA
jgi:hypothetical protein